MGTCKPSFLANPPRPLLIRQKHLCDADMAALWLTAVAGTRTAAICAKRAWSRSRGLRFTWELRPDHFLAATATLFWNLVCNNPHILRPCNTFNQLLTPYIS